MWRVSGRAPGTVVIVDDATPVRHDIERVVEPWFTPRTCGSYDEAERVLAELCDPPAALIVEVDLGPGRGDGLDLAQYAHDRFAGRVPTLVITGASLTPETTERASRLRAELLLKPQSVEVLQLFLDRVRIRATWGATDILDLNREMQRFADSYALTRRQRDLLFQLLRAAERGERAEINGNTRKAGLRRILKRTGHSNFEALRHAVKRRALGEPQQPDAPPGPQP
jgi:DNA-binding NarL/FixJ family response regulator